MSIQYKFNTSYTHIIRSIKLHQIQHNYFPRFRSQPTNLTNLRRQLPKTYQPTNTQKENQFLLWPPTSIAITMLSKEMNTQRTTTTKPNNFTLFLSTTRLFFFLPILIYNYSSFWKQHLRRSVKVCNTFYLIEC